MASHDLKNPLTNLRVAQVLLKELIDPNDVRSHTVLDTMTLTISTMQQVIEDFLDSAAAQSGALDIRLQAVNADALLQQVIEQQLPIAYDKQIDLQMANAGLWIHADPARLLQVLQNLLGNAIKYSPVGSEVRLWATDNGQYVRLYVTDQGPGIPETERIKLFQPFGKASNRPTGGESSHGLGLWIAKHLTELHNGRIGVEASPEGGSQFWVDIPAAQ